MKKNASGVRENRKFRIDLLEDREAGVFVITSKDIPGLVLEAETLVGIMDALMEYGPELVRSNLCIPIKEGEFQVAITPRTAPRKSDKSARKTPLKSRVSLMGSDFSDRKPSPLPASGATARA